MDRRTALLRTMQIMGSTLYAPAILTVLDACKSRPALDWTPLVLTSDQATLAAGLADTIIPRTDSPGASDMGVPTFIDLILSDVFTEEDRKHFVEGMDAFQTSCEEVSGQPFGELDEKTRTNFVVQSLQNVNDQKSFIVIFKELTLLGFFTSEAGAQQVLQYEAVPGSFEGCLPLETVGRTWAT